ncbi:MAG: ATP-dependent sacrificial sulfur transferase LarE [Oscillospiraceae bacterium]|nr:ATP-dependent sacrificial sulfur transferase LarE [Oscillospiraceae bacterium]
MTLREFFEENPVCAVAFSGGVDSAVLLSAAAAYGRKAAAYFVRTVFQPGFELEDARETAGRLGVELRVLEADILAVPEVAANPADRCYYCKRALFTRLLEEAARDGFPVVLDGGNASDDAGDRPGMRALAELGIRSPLRECGIGKAEVRRMAREAGLRVWDKPSYACLATRVPAGTAVSAAALARVERGETALMALGFSDLRLRLRGEDGLLQVREEQLELARRLLPEIRERLGGDFRTVWLDDVPRESRET